MPRPALGLALAAAFAAALGCGGQNAVMPPGGPVPSAQLCARLVEATCDWGMRCGVEPNDRPTCLEMVTALFDGCPLMVTAVALGEAEYDPEAAALYVAETRGRACTALSPDPVALGVFTPQLAEGQACHSAASCKAGLRCNGSTTSMPEGVCGAP